MPTDRAPTPLSNTTISLGTSDDRSSERSDSIATIEIFRSDGEPLTRTPSETTENADCETVTRHRTPNGDGQKFASCDIPEIILERKKSNGISKGVILNAMNFGSCDLKCSPDDIKEKAVVLKDQQLSENGSLTPKALEASSESNLKSVENEKGEEEKKKMSLPRKIAFGFSFLPSVMFVLTFAVILPCEEYKYAGQCVKNKWSLLLNNTEISSDFSLPETLLLGYAFVNSTGSFDGLVNLNAETGKEIWKLPLDSLPKQLECLNVDVNEDGVEDCLTILENGNICAFNLSDGHIFWTFRSDQKKDAAILLTGCPFLDGVKPIAVASYSNESTLGLDVLSGSNGSLLAYKEVKFIENCISFSMKSWKHDNEMDLVFLCKDDEDLGYISRLRQSLWCSPGEEGSVIMPQSPLMRFYESTAEVMYLPSYEGILIWTVTQMTFLESDGTVRWRDSTRYVLQNRISELGNFYAGGEQVALIGQNGSSGIVVSVLTSENGKELITLSVPDRTLNQAVVLRGNETDGLLLSVLKVKVIETEQASDKDVVLVSNVTSSPDFRTDVPYKVNGKRSVVEELILFQFEGKNTTHVVLESEIPTSCSSGGVCESEYQASHILSAFSEEKENSVNLKIVTLKSVDNYLKQNGSQPFSQLTALDITHNDNQITGVASCTL